MPIPLSQGVIHLWTVRLDAPPNEEVLRILSREEHRRAERFRAERDRARYIAAHGGLRNILARYLDRSPVSLRFARGPWGKPYLGDPAAPRFNLSHSGDLALVAVTREAEIGVDVERMAPIADLLDLARAYFSEREQHALSQLAPRERDAAFFRCWTRKEALIKATGRGLAQMLDRFDVPVAPGDVSIRLGIDGAETRWSVRTVEPAPGYIAAVALHGDVGRLHQMSTW